jgi:hypothetical protein
MNRAMLLRGAAVLIPGAAGIWLLASFGPLQWPTVLVYTGLVIVLGGIAGIVRPPRWLGICRRSDAAFTALGGAMVLLGGLFWPAATLSSTGSTRLDALLPEYEFHEFHELRIHASPERTMEAVRQVTFAELGVMRSLGRIRSVAMGNFRGAPPPPLPAKPIVGLISSGATGFFPLGDLKDEFLFGLAGQPWKNGARPIRLTSESFRSWMDPGQVKIASNLRVEPDAPGWSRLSTETRVHATDGAARSTMARYWRFIYPGSGMIRQSLLRAVQARAEQP